MTADWEYLLLLRNPIPYTLLLFPELCCIWLWCFCVIHQEQGHGYSKWKSEFFIYMSNIGQMTWKWLKQKICVTTRHLTFFQEASYIFVQWQVPFEGILFLELKIIFKKTVKKEDRTVPVPKSMPGSSLFCRATTSSIHFSLVFQIPVSPASHWASKQRPLWRFPLSSCVATGHKSVVTVYSHCWLTQLCNIEWVTCSDILDSQVLKKGVIKASGGECWSGEYQWVIGWALPLTKPLFSAPTTLQVTLCSWTHLGWRRHMYCKYTQYPKIIETAVIAQPIWKTMIYEIYD